MRRTGAWEELSAWAKLQSAAVVRFQLQENLARCGNRERCGIKMWTKHTVKNLLGVWPGVHRLHYPRSEGVGRVRFYSKVC